MAGLIPATHLPGMASLAAEKGVDHRVKPGDGVYLLGFLPNLLQHFAISLLT
jgi:hypothetical protein